MNTLDIETFIPAGEIIIAWRLAESLRCSRNHIRHLIESGCIRVPKKELGLLKRKMKPWTMASIPRASVITFLHKRTTAAFRSNTRQEVAAQ